MRTPAIMSGYWNMPAATREVLTDGWYHTGDAGYLDDDGYLYLRARVKDMIVSGAENVYPAEVESALHGHPLISDVAVIGVPDETWGESVKAIVVPVAGATLDMAELLAFCRTQLAGYKLPKSFDVVDAIPRNASGKILKYVLREPYWQGRDRAIN